MSKANMSTAKGVASPMASSTKQSKVGSTNESDPHTTMFRSIIGALQYATVIIPKIPLQ